MTAATERRSAHPAAEIAEPTCQGAAADDERVDTERRQPAAQWSVHHEADIAHLSRRLPVSSKTSQAMRSLIRIVTTPGDVADDVVARPPFGGERGHVVRVDGEVDGDADRADAVVGDAAGVVEGRSLDVGRELGEPCTDRPRPKR